jgi:hypothetical protein
MYARFIKPFGCVAEGGATNRKNAARIRMAAIDSYPAPPGSHFVVLA